MPSYGDDKIRDMIRSVLPSRARKMARLSKQQVNQDHRRKVRISMRTMDPDEMDADMLDHQARIQTNYVVQERRGADKVNPLMRWAPQVTSGPPDMRRAQLKALMPSGVIGDHARGHVEYLKEFDINPWLGRVYSRDYTPYKTRHEMRKEALYHLLTQTGLHGELNKFLQKNHRMHIETIKDPKSVSGYRTVYKGTHVARKLMGLHDIDAFLADLSKVVHAKWDGRKWLNEDTHPEWEGALDTFLEKHIKGFKIKY